MGDHAPKRLSKTWSITHPLSSRLIGVSSVSRAAQETQKLGATSALPILRGHAKKKKKKSAPSRAKCDES